jgi:uncharacterized membrane protein HdeD (DUF308 family)
MATTPASPPGTDTAAAADGARSVEVPEAERYWYLFVVSGVISGAIGILVLAYPDPSVKLLGVFLGIDLLVVGGLLLVRGMSSASTPAEGPAEVLLGTLAIIGGLVVIRNPGESLTLLVVAFGVYLIVAGALALSRGLVSRERRGPTLLRGLVLVAAGTVIIAVPDIGLTTLAIVAGIALLLQGIAEIAEGLLLRKLRTATEY